MGSQGELAAGGRNCASEIETADFEDGETSERSVGATWNDCA